MPTRYLKPGIRDSETIDQLSPLAEILFYRLLVTVDDFGRYDARPSLIKAQCFPVKDSVTAKKCQELMAELAAVGLLLLYSSEGKEYMQLQRWDNKPRATESNFPAFADTCIQTYTDVKHPHTNVPLTVTVTETQTDPDGFALFWSAYPKKTAKPAALKAFKAKKINGELKTILADIDRRSSSPDWQKDGGQYIPNPATYLNNRRWEDQTGQQTTNIWAGAI